MKKLLLLLLLLCSNVCATMHAQNLIPNGDFELGPDSSSAGWAVGYPFDTIGGGCNSQSLLNGPSYWYVVSGSPDRMVWTHMPGCNWDNDSAYSGNAYCVFGSGNNNYTEAGKATLISPLEKDSVYHLHYCLSWQTFEGVSTDPCQIAIIFNNGGNSINSPIITTKVWNCFDTLFFAASNSTEITIRGIYPTGLYPAANVDNLFLEKISGTGINIINANDENVIVFPNPANNLLNIKTINKIYNVAISDFYGRTLLRDNKSLIDTSCLSSGMYIIRIKTDKGFSTKKFFINH